MSTAEAAEKAVDILNSSDVGGRAIKVDIARDRPPREDNRGGEGSGGCRGGGAAGRGGSPSGDDRF